MRMACASLGKFMVYTLQCQALLVRLDPAWLDIYPCTKTISDFDGS